ncbi:MAG: ArnT family glycosyltransferase [bacterium]
MPRLGYIILIIAFILRLGFVFGTHAFINPETVEPGVIAHAMVAGLGFSFAFPGSDIYQPTAGQPPLFPLLLAGLYYLFGETSLAYLILMLIQSILSVWLCYLVYQIGKLVFDEKIGLTAMLFTAIYPIFIIYSGRATNTMISVVTVIWFIYLFLRFMLLSKESPKISSLILVGISGGIAMLAESIMISFILICFIIHGFILFRNPQSAIRNGRLRSILIVVLVAAAIVSPWTIRNYLVFHRLVLVRTMFGMNLWQGNNPMATGTNTLPDGRPMFDFPKEYYNLAITEPDRDQILLNTAKQYMIEHPGETCRLFLKKCYYFWWFPPNNIVTPAAAKYANLMRIPFALLLILVLIGTRFAIKHKKYLVLSIFWLLFLNYMLVYGITHFGHFRYRAPVEPLLLILAAFGLIQLFVKNKKEVTS